MDFFMSGLFDIVLFLFDKTDNVLIIIPTAVALFILALNIVRRLMRRV